MLCLSYCLVGLNRTVRGRNRSLHRRHDGSVGHRCQPARLLLQHEYRLAYSGVAVGRLHASQRLPVITVFEITAPLCLAVPHYRWIFIPVMFLVSPAQPRLHEHPLLRRHARLSAAHRLVATVPGHARKTRASGSRPATRLFRFARADAVSQRQQDVRLGQ